MAMSISGFHTTQELLEGTSVRRLVICLGIPAMLGQFFNILYNIIDRIFIGNIPETGNIALASIGICAPALTALTAFAFMVGIGGASYMSISLGQRDWHKAQEIIGNAAVMLLVISAVVMAFLLLNREGILYLLGCSESMYPYAEAYFTIYIGGTFASFLGCGLNQFVMAQGFAKQGMVSVVIGAVVNVMLDPLLIFRYNLAANCVRMYTFALLGVAVQYALVDGLTAMGKVSYALPLSLFRKIIYIICICTLPLFLDIRYIFYTGTISDAVGASFSLLLFFCVINPKIKRELNFG